MPDYVELIGEFLGEPWGQPGGESYWDSLESELDFQFPLDYKKIVDRYGGATLNGHFRLKRPADGRWSLGADILSTIQAYRDVDWSDEPQEMFRGAMPVFGGADGLVPVASIEGEGDVFLIRTAESLSVVICSKFENEFFEHETDFSEFMYQYLCGENMAGPGSSDQYPGPIKIRYLPMSPEDRPELRFGPTRD